MLVHIFQILIGFAVLVKSADIFLSRVIKISRATRLSTFFLSMFLISISTSLPEILISSISSSIGEYELSLGNLFGTLVVNIGFGLCLPIFLLKKGRHMSLSPYVSEIFFMLWIAILSFFFLKDSTLSIAEGFFIFLFLPFLFLLEKGKETRKMSCEKKKASVLKEVVFLLTSLFLMFFSSRIAVEGMVGVCDAMGISRHFMGITVSAIGTSLPEIVTSILAVLRGRPEISVGTVVGSNIVDMCVIEGVIPILSNVKATSAILTDLAMFSIFSLLLLALSFKRIQKPLAFLTFLLTIFYFFLPPLEERIAELFISFSTLVLGSYLIYKFWRRTRRNF